jgi:uncharacterized protein YndB with AHSA1/START domain
MKYTGSVRYEDIVPNHALSFSETVRLEDTTLGISLITWELWPERNGAKLVVTDQLVSLDGADMVKGTRAGMNGALDNLGQWLALGAVTP